MFSVLEKPAFLILLIVLVVMGVVVAIVIVASRSGSRTNAAPPHDGSVPPGWYAQPDGGQRYWNGTAWTGDVQPPTGSTASS